MCPCAFITARLGRKSMAAGASAIAKTAAGCKLQSMKNLCPVFAWRPRAGDDATAEISSRFAYGNEEL